MRKSFVAASGTLALFSTVQAWSAGPVTGLPEQEPTVAVYLSPSGTEPVATDRTVPHWHGQFTDPTNGVTYGFNMVGSDPASRTSTTVEVDVVPLDYTFSGSGDYQLNGSDVIDRVMASPIFQTADYSSTPSVTGPADSTGHTPIVPGGTLSQGNVGVQFLDAYMQSQFNAVGTAYHLRLHPIVHPAVKLTVPQDQGAVFVNRRGVVYGEQAGNWNAGLFSAVEGKLNIDPTHLLVFVTNNVLVGFEKGCCALGVHSATKTAGKGNGSISGQGLSNVPTWIFAAYVQPGTYNPAFFPYISDVDTLSHEITEWADDPFGNNTTNTWSTPESPLYGCQAILEVGDPVVAVGFALPGNTFDTGPFADGYWHPEDAVFLPWFARQAPNTTSQPTQQPSALVGRYTFMGDLNPYADFHQPATGCH